MIRPALAVPAPPFDDPPAAARVDAPGLGSSAVPPTRSTPPRLADCSVRELIAELARLEDELRVASPGGHDVAGTSPDRRSLLWSQRLVVAELRRRQSQWRSTTAAR